MSDTSYLIDQISAITDALDRHFDSVSEALKKSLRDSSWLPGYVKPRPPPISRKTPVVALPVGLLEASRIWLSEHRAVTAAVVAFVGTGAFIVWKRGNADRAKRRARRAKNGSRTEVVILAGSPYSPLTRSLSLDLERRGFIVYIPVGTLPEEQIPQSTAETIQKFTRFIETPQRPLSNGPPHDLHLVSLLLIPASTLAAKPITMISPPEWSDTLNTHLLAPFTTLHAFLPLLASQKASLLFLNPSIVPSLTPPSRAAESVVAGGMQQYIETLRKEMKPQSINIVQFQLGLLDYGPALSENQQLVLSQYSPRAEFARQRLEQKGKKPVKGVSMRELHNGVFDAIVRCKGRNRTVFVGRGSRTYDLVGKWVPSGMVGWMMGVGKTSRAEGEEREKSVEGSAEWDKVDDDDDRYVYPRKR